MSDLFDPKTSSPITYAAADRPASQGVTPDQLRAAATVAQALAARESARWRPAARSERPRGSVSGERA